MQTIKKKVSNRKRNHGKEVRGSNPGKTNFMHKGYMYNAYPGKSEANIAFIK